MKNTKPKLPAPLTNGALITRREITLGMGHTALVEIRYDGPNQPTPTTGADWPPETDWPAARLKLSLPNQHGYNPHEDMQIDTPVCGNRFLYIPPGEHRTLSTWASNYSPEKHTCSREVRKAGTSLRQLAAEMLRDLMAELRPVQAHLKAREARLAQRQATLLAGQDVRPLKEPATTT